MKRTISLALVLMLLLGAFAGCGSDPAETTASAEVTDTTAAETETETLYEPDDLPADLRYDGETINTFGWSGPAAIEFFAEEMNGELVNDAIYQRNLTVEERLGVQLEYVLQPGAYNDRNTWANTVVNSVQAGDGAYDIASGYSMSGATLAFKGVSINLNDLQYLNFDKPWWPASLQEEATCGGKLYFCSGDISTYMIYYLYGTYFNKQLIIDHDLENPYDLVREGTWTLDKMMEMSSGIYQDLNGDGTKDVGDTYGFATHSTYTDPIYFGVGLRTTEKGEDDIPVLSPSFGGERAHWLLETLVGFFATNDAWLETKDYANTDNMFKEGRALFSNNEFLYAAVKIRDAELEYGIVPLPKYDEAQKEYHTVMSFPYSLYSVPIDARDPDMSAAVLECLASESHRTVVPALFETGMKVKYAQDDEAAQMFDLIRSSAVFDFGRVFNESMNGMTYSLFRSAVSGAKENWMSIYASNEKALTAALEKVVTALVGE